MDKGIIIKELRKSVKIMRNLWMFFTLSSMVLYLVFYQANFAEVIPNFQYEFWGCFTLFQVLAASFFAAFLNLTLNDFAVKYKELEDLDDLIRSRLIREVNDLRPRLEKAAITLIIKHLKEARLNHEEVGMTEDLKEVLSTLSSSLLSLLNRIVLESDLSLLMAETDKLLRGVSDLEDKIESQFQTT